MKAAETPRIVSREEWERARAELLVREKEHTHASDTLAATRRRLPMTLLEPVTVITAVFAVRGLIDWKLGLILGVESFAGAVAGAAVARNLSDGTLQPVFLIAVLALATKTLLYDGRW